MKNTYKTPAVPENERARLEKLQVYKQLDNYQQSGSFQHVVKMAARIFEVPIALVDFVEDDKVVIQTSTGIAGVKELKREITLCSLAILQDEVTVFENASAEPGLLGNPMVHGNFNLQFYAAAPLQTPDGFNLGVLAIADTRPRKFSAADAGLLQQLAAVVMDELTERLSQAGSAV